MTNLFRELHRANCLPSLAFSEPHSRTQDISAREAATKCQNRGELFSVRYTRNLISNRDRGTVSASLVPILHGARLPLSCWPNRYAPVFELTAPYLFVLGYSLPRSVMKGFWVALLIAAQLVVNASTMAAEKGTMNHHGIPPLLLIK
jgi:hypothetical protein